MYKKIFIFVFCFVFIVSISGIVYGSETNEKLIYDKIGIKDKNGPNVLIESKSFVLDSGSSANKIQKVHVSRPVFKAGTKINLRVYTDKSIKSISGSISGKSKYKFTKTKHGFWQHSLNTKGFKTGDYKVNIVAIDSKRKVHKSSTLLTANNVAPKIYSVSTNTTLINAGDPFTINVSAENSTKKIVAEIRGKNYSFKYLNDTDWQLNVKLSYKEISSINISVNAYDSLGNVAKRNTFIDSKPHFVYWSGSLLTHKKHKISYPNPRNEYERSINQLSKHATVYEGFAGDHRTLGITYRISQGKNVRYTVTIAYKDPFVVYHELAHVLNWRWSEYNCDWYAYNKTGYWIK